MATFYLPLLNYEETANLAPIRNPIISFGKGRKYFIDLMVCHLTLVFFVDFS